MAVGAVSMPVAARPRAAAMRACSPVPHPASSTRPRMAPRSASSRNAGWGRPMSQGGVAPYAASKSGSRSRASSLAIGRLILPCQCGALHSAAVKRVLVLGSTGSIGEQALEVVDREDDLLACGLACGGRSEVMAAQAAARGIAHTACAGGDGTVLYDPDLEALIEASAPDLVLNGLVGAAGLRPTLAALARGIPVALANKESLVVGGDLVAAARAVTGAALVPVDSEHSALFQLLTGLREGPETAVLTASGGPFRGRDAAALADVGVAEALAHPTWAMGAKITIDSATLMNKGLELIEAHHLFGLPYDRIEVVVHPQSLVHALVRLEDGSLLAHCGPPEIGRAHV